MIFSKRLRSLRKSLNLTQKQQASALGMTTTGYQNYERGINKPSLDQAIALADFYGVSLDYLVGRSDDPKQH